MLFVEQLSAEGLTKVRQIKYLYTLGTISRLMNKDFTNSTKQDIIKLCSNINNTNYTEWTKRDFKIVIKRFYKWLKEKEGQQFDKRQYPNEVKWINTSLKRERKKLPKELLTTEDVKKLTENTNNLRDRCFILVLYESGARIGELLNLKLKDIEYIHDLLSHPFNDILVPPTIEFYEPKVPDPKDPTKMKKVQIPYDKKIDIYHNLLKNYLEIKNGTQDAKIGITIPSFYPHGRINELFGFYDKENKLPQFCLIDFAGQRITKHYEIVTPIFREAKKHFEDDESFFLYGFNIRPYKKSSESSPSEELIGFSCGLNSIGPLRGKPLFIKKIPDPYAGFPKKINSADYYYHKLSPEVLPNLIDWVNQRKSQSITGVNELRPEHLHGYNTVNINSIGDTIAQGILKGEKDTINNSFTNKSIKNDGSCP